mmetsp:Transcript_34740/g.63156  ORF Transcript_34740/g.63156 Transcript_34740/m.63156 type:complete len:271 (-) Transcript_34740:453-1265(-)
MSDSTNAEGTFAFATCSRRAKTPVRNSLAARAYCRSHIVVILVVVEVAEVNEQRQCHHHCLPFGIFHLAKLDVVVVNITCEHELAAARHFLLDVTHESIICYVFDIEVHLRARPTRQRTNKSRLTAASRRLQNGLACGVLYLESEIAESERIDNGANLLFATHDVNDIHFRSIEAAAGKCTRSVHVECFSIHAAAAMMENVDIPRSTIRAVILRISAAAICLLYCVEELVGATLGKYLVSVCHFNLHSQSSGESLNERCLLFDLNPWVLI